MAILPNRPTAIIEGRAPLPNQLVTRQTYLPKKLEAEGIQTAYVKIEDSESHDVSGRIQRYTAYGSGELVHAALDPDSYVWRLRDPIWTEGDPSAYQNGWGYNSQRARQELNTRQGLAKVLKEIGLDKYGVGIVDASGSQKWQPDELVFIKPDRINDVSERPGTRARLMRTDEIDTLSTSSDGMILQRQETVVSAQDLVNHLGVAADSLDPHVNYLHAVRVFAPLWLPPGGVPAVELRLTNPREDIGKFFATCQYLLEPKYAYERLPQLAALHQTIHAAFLARYGKQNYLTFDYIIMPDGSVKMLNGLVRGLTPNLEHQSSEVQHLANATADVEVRHLAELALSRFNT